MTGKHYFSCRALRGAFFLLPVLLLCVLLSPGRSEPVLPPVPASPSTPLLPYLDYFLDENGDMDIEEAAAPDHADKYRALAMRSLPNACGVMWLRFTLGALPAGMRPPTLLLDMGDSIPGVPVLYQPENNQALGTMEWREVTPSQRNLLLLPDAGQAPLTCYLRIDGLPGLWFSPTLRTPQNAADNWGGLSRHGAILALGVVMLLCLLRAFSEKGQWRVWTALYVGAALAQAVAGMPETGSGHVNMREAAAVMLPGIALMLLPHVGRHLMHTRGHWRALDIQLLLLSLPGAALALLPILPSWLWLARWLDLWPACCLLFVPTALAAWIAGAEGSRRFLLGCLLPPIAVGAAIVGLDFSWPANLLASLPLWGTALSALIIATGRSAPAADSGDPGAERSDMLSIGVDGEPSGIIDLGGPVAPPAPQADPLRPAAVGAEERQRESHVAADVGQPAGSGDGKDETFNLQQLLRSVHDEAGPRAEAKGIGLAWYMPPQLDQCYRGNAGMLARTLRMLLANSLAATRNGAIHLSVRRVPESRDPGNLLFTVSDSGSGMRGRSADALARACELAAGHGGYVGLECGPDGATVAFTMHLACPGEDSQLPQEPLVIVAAETASMTRTLAHMLREMPCRVRQAQNFETVLEIQKEDPAILLVAQGSLASPASGPEVRRFAELAHVAHLPLCKRLAITIDQSEWAALGRAGFTHALEEPVDDESLRATVAGILDKMRDILQEASSGAVPPHGMPQPRDCASPARRRVAPPAVSAATETDGQPETAHSGVAAAPGPDNRPEAEAPRGPADAAEQAAENLPHGAVEPAAESAGASAGAVNAIAPAEGGAGQPERDEHLQSLPWPGAGGRDLPESAPHADAERRDIEAVSDQVRLPETEQTESPQPLPMPGALAADPQPMPESARNDARTVAPAKEPPRPEPELPAQPENSDRYHAGPAPQIVTETARPVEDQTAAPRRPAQAEASAQPASSFMDNALAAGIRRGSSTQTYVSHHLGQPGEWVGEPMPIGTPVTAHREPSTPARGAGKPTRASTVRATHKYEGPAVRQPGEWVGEPMPIGTPIRSEVQTAPSADGESILDFIAGPRQPVDEPQLQTLVTRIAETAMNVAASQGRARNDMRTADTASGRRQQPEPAPIAAGVERPAGPAKPADPTLAAVVSALDDAMEDARRAYASGNARPVAEASALIASKAEAFGFRVLARMARCVEQAARARDMDALGDLLPELSSAVERNRIALSPKE